MLRFASPVSGSLYAICSSPSRASLNPRRAPSSDAATPAASSCMKLKLAAIAPTSSRVYTTTGSTVTRACAASRLPLASASMARVRSASVPVASWSAARATWLMAWLIIPGSTSPTEIVSSATATKMSSSAVTSTCWCSSTRVTASR